MEQEFCTGALQRGISIDEIINIQFKPVDWPAKSFVGHWNTFCIYVYQLKLSDLHFVCSKLLFSMYPFQPFFSRYFIILPLLIYIRLGWQANLGEPRQTYHLSQIEFAIPSSSIDVIGETE